MHGHAVDAVLQPLCRAGLHHAGFQNTHHLSLQVLVGRIAGLRNRRGRPKGRQALLQLAQQGGVAMAAHGHGLYHRQAEFLGEARGVDHQPLAPGLIGHIECHEQRLAQALEFQHQAQIQAQVGGIDYRHDGVWRGLTGAAAFNHFQRDFFIGRGRLQAISTGQVDHAQALAAGQHQLADLVLDRHPRVVGYFLAGAGEQVEEGRFAAIRVAYQGYVQDGGAHRLAWGSLGRTSMLRASGKRKAKSESPTCTAKGSRPPGPRRTTRTTSPAMNPISPKRRKVARST